MKNFIFTAALILLSVPLAAQSAGCYTNENNCQGNANFSFEGSKATCCNIFRNDGSSPEKICVPAGQERSVPVRTGAERSNCLDADQPLPDTPRLPIFVRETGRTQLITVRVSGKHVVEASPQTLEIEDVVCSTRVGRIQIRKDALVPIRVCVNSSGYAQVRTRNVTYNPSPNPINHSFLKADGDPITNW